MRSATTIPTADSAPHAMASLQRASRSDGWRGGSSGRAMIQARSMSFFVAIPTGMPLTTLIALMLIFAPAAIQLSPRVTLAPEPYPGRVAHSWKAWAVAVRPGTGWPGDPATPRTPVARSSDDVAQLAARARTRNDLDARVSVCRACPRLVQWRETVALEKRRAFADQTYWGRPVPSFG